MKLRPPKNPPTNPIEWSRWLREQEIASAAETSPSPPETLPGTSPDDSMTASDIQLHWFLQ